MMGDFDQENGEMLARDGVTVPEDVPNEFAAEWQVGYHEAMLFQAIHGPQYPQTCLLPNLATKTRRQRRLGASIARGAAEKACAHLQDTRERDACILDVLAIGDMDVASSEY